MITKYVCYESPSGELHWFREDKVQLIDLNSDWVRVSIKLVLVTEEDSSKAPKYKE